MGSLTIALPKGRLQDKVLALFARAGYHVSSEELDSRRLILGDETRSLRFVLAKPLDIPTYVEYGATDLGVVGEDVLREQNRDVYEPLELGLGVCRLVVAGPPSARDQNLRLLTNLRIATKYPRLAREHFRRLGMSPEIIPLNGSIELAPAVGLADLLVDLVQTGRTLRENGLVELETILTSQATLIVNRAAHKMRFERIRALIRQLSEHLRDAPARS